MILLNAMTISLELDYNIFSNRKDYENLFNDQRIFKFGFEYFLTNSKPLRAGIVYKTSVVALIPPTSIITFGTGGKIWDFFYLMVTCPISGIQNIHIWHRSKFFGEISNECSTCRCSQFLFNSTRITRNSF